jgi:hypothetical protein
MNNEEFCGETFHYYRGRISWLLRAVGPITVSVKTRIGPFSVFPLYVEIARALTPECIDDGIGYVVLVAEGSIECGGVWQTVGPLDITRWTPLGSLYRIQVVALDGNPVPNARSVGLACVRVTTTPTTSAVQASSWTRVRNLYR